MKNHKLYFISLIIFLFVALPKSQAQEEQGSKKAYSSTSLEIIFSLADVSADSISISNVLRFAPVFNFQYLINKDLSKNFGLYTGLDIKNLGFIRQTQTTTGELKYKHRSYALGLPVGLKVGNLENGTFLYLGGQIEWCFNYKQKEFQNGNKTNKFLEWNSDRVNQWQPSVFVGINLPYGTNIKFKYYFNNFLNDDYKQIAANGDISYPYAGQNSQIFYFSLNFMMFEPVKDYKDFY